MYMANQKFDPPTLQYLSTKKKKEKEKILLIYHLNYIQVGIEKCAYCYCRKDEEHDGKASVHLYFLCLVACLKCKLRFTI